MPQPKAAPAVLAVLAALASLGSLGACSSAGYAQSTSDVERAVETRADAGAFEVVLPAGAASGGTLAVQEGPSPKNVPEGVKALGPSAVVSLLEGKLDGTMEVSIDPPAALTAAEVPIVMTRTGGGGDAGDWHWVPTSWQGGQSKVTARLTSTGEVFLARFDPAPYLDDLDEEFTAKTNNPSKVDAPDCGDQKAAADAGLEVSSEQGDLVLWCDGVDTIESNPSVDGYDLDYGEAGVQARVLRVTNNSRMFNEVGYPADWPAVDGSGRALPGQLLRQRLGLAGSTRDGLASRVLAPGETLSLLLTSADATGTVTADLSAAAWTLSAIDFASSTYTRMVTEVDGDLGDQVRTTREQLMSSLVGPVGSNPADDGTSGTGGPAADLASLRDCLAPVSQVVLMNQDAAQQLADQALQCTPDLLRPALGDLYGAGPAQMADGVATDVVTGLPATLGRSDAPWAQISDVLTDEHAGFQVWVGPPPPQSFDYSDEPQVFHPGAEVAVQGWSTDFSAYVEQRLASLGTGRGSCSKGELSVSRYRTDGFALAAEVGCDGEEHRLVLGRVDGTWQEIDSIQQDPYFGCGVMGTYSVPAFIAGDTCLDGDHTQEYTG